MKAATATMDFCMFAVKRLHSIIQLNSEEINAAPHKPLLGSAIKRVSKGSSGFCVGRFPGKPQVFNDVIPAQAGIPWLFIARQWDSRLRGNDKDIEATHRKSG